MNVKHSKGPNGRDPEAEHGLDADPAPKPCMRPDSSDTVWNIDWDAAPSFKESPFSPARARETTRGRIALLLVVLLAIQVIVAWSYVFVFPDRIVDAGSFVGIMLGPVVSLVGAATGFYFGAQTQRGEERYP